VLAVISGGNWNNGSNAGLWACNLNNWRSNSNTNIGFRCAYGFCLKARRGGLEPQGCTILRSAKQCWALLSGIAATAAQNVRRVS